MRPSRPFFRIVGRTAVRTVALVAALAGPAASAHAQAQPRLPFTITFDGLTSPTTLTDIQSPTFAPDARLGSGSMAVTTSSTATGQGFASWGSADDGAANYTGSTAVFAALGGTQINLVNTAGFGFDLYSIDLAPLFAPATLGLTSIPPFQVTFNGRAVGSSTFFQQVFTIPASSAASPAYTRLAFDSRFTNLVQVAWFNQGAGTGCPADQCTHQFDNVTGAVVTPEPGTVALSAAGLAVLAFGAGRRRRAAASAA